MKAATGIWAMSSVILSTWVITLSTLLRYLPLSKKSMWQILQKLKAMSLVQIFTSYDDNCAGTWKVLSISSRDKLKTILWIFIIQSHLNLLLTVLMLNVFSAEQIYILTWGQGRGVTKPKFRMKHESMMSLPSIQWTDFLTNSSFSLKGKNFLDALFWSLSISLKVKRVKKKMLVLWIRIEQTIINALLLFKKNNVYVYGITQPN